MHAPWTALYVETGQSLQFSEEKHDNIAEALRLAERLGADPITIPGGGRFIADDILAYAQANNFTQIVIGKTKRSRWFELVNNSIVNALIRKSGNIGVHVISGDDSDDGKPRKKPGRGDHAVKPVEASPYIMSLLIVVAALAAAELLKPAVGVNNITLVFLTAVVCVAVSFGLLPSLLAVTVATLCYNFFFLPPIFTFTISDPANVSTPVLLHTRRGACVEPRSTVAAPSRGRPIARAYHRGALQFQP